MLNGQSMEDMEAAAELHASDDKKATMQHDALLHAVFMTPQGEQLLELWKGILMRPIVTSRDLLDIGANEGRNNFIRHVIQSIDQAKG